jgi:hypothetical protein
MSIANPLCGAPRIHGELLKLDIAIGQTGVAKYMAKRRGPPSRGWKTFLLNHADGIAAMDLFVAPTISFRLLYGLLIMGHGRRRGMDRKPVHGSLWMAAASPLSDPRSRWSVWRSFHPTTSVNGHSRSADAAALPMAKRICRTADRFDATRMPRPRRGVRRAPPPSPTAFVHEILQWRPHASILGEGCAGLACRRTGRAVSLSPKSRRAAPPIRQDLIFDRHR